MGSTAASQITHGTELRVPLGWSPDSKRIFVETPQAKSPLALFSLSVTGGEPEFVMSIDAALPSISQDGKVLTVVQKEEDGS